MGHPRPNFCLVYDALACKVDPEQYTPLPILEMRIGIIGVHEPGSTLNKAPRLQSNRTEHSIQHEL